MNDLTVCKSLLTRRESEVKALNKEIEMLRSSLERVNKTVEAKNAEIMVLGGELDDLGAIHFEDVTTVGGNVVIESSTERGDCEVCVLKKQEIRKLKGKVRRQNDVIIGLRSRRELCKASMDVCGSRYQEIYKVLKKVGIIINDEFEKYGDKQT